MGKIQTTVTAATIIALLVGAVLTVSSITATTGTFTTVDSTIIYVADITNRTTDGYVEIMRLVVENGSSFPSSPSIGHVFFNTALDTLTVYNGTSWVNMTTSDVVADHGALTGLTDDDHTIYLLADGTRALSATWDVSSQGIIGLTWLNTTSLVFTDEIWYGLDNRTDVIANPQEAWSYLIYVDPDNSSLYHGKASNGTICWTSTNASYVMNNAIDSERSIFVGAGDYDLGATALAFFDLNDVTFTGEGKSTYIHGTADDILDIRRCTGLLITNLKITHNSTYGAIYDAIDMDDSQNCIVSNVWIVGDGTHGGNGITVDGGALGTSYYNFVTDNYIENVPGMGIQLIDSIGNGICGNVINKTGSYGIGLSSASTQNTIQANRINNSSIGIHLVSNTVKSNTVNTNTVVNTTNQGIYINGQNNTISGNTVSNTLGEGIYIERSDNTVSINTVVDADSYGIYVSGSRNTVSTNVVNGVTGGSVRGIGVYNGAENVVSANSVTGCAQGLYTFGSTRTLWTSNIVTSCTTAGFWTWSSNDNRFVGNRFYNNDRGIFVDSSANNYFIFANFFESNTNDGIRIDSGTGNVIQGNLFSSNGATITVPVTTTIIKDNGGYNPLGVIANPILSGQTTLLDSGGDSQIANATTYTNWCSPKTVYMQDADTFDVYVEGQLVADDVNQYVVTLQPSDTFKIEWVSALTTLKFVGN